MSDTRDRNKLVVKILEFHDTFNSESPGIDPMYKKGLSHGLYWVLEFCLAFYSEQALQDEEWQEWRPPDYPSSEFKAESD